MSKQQDKVMMNKVNEKLAALSPQHEPFYLVFSTVVGEDIKTIFPRLKEHTEYLKALNDDGKLLFAGPLQTTAGELTGDGLYTLKVDNLTEAMQIVEADPFHKEGIRKAEVLVWQSKVKF